MKKKTRCIMLSPVIAVFLGGVSVVACFLIFVLPLRMQSPKMAVLDNPSSRRVANLLEEGFVDRGFTLFVPFQDSNEQVARDC